MGRNKTTTDKKKPQKLSKVAPAKAVEADPATAAASEEVGVDPETLNAAGPISAESTETPAEKPLENSAPEPAVSASEEPEPTPEQGEHAVVDSLPPSVANVIGDVVDQGAASVLDPLAIDPKAGEVKFDQPGKSAPPATVVTPATPSRGVQKAVPRAVPNRATSRMETSVAKSTCTKHIGKWYKLFKGEKITAPREVIVTLRRGGFVE